MTDITRRDVLRGTAAAAGATAATAATTSPALANHSQSEDDAPWHDYTATDAVWDSMVATSPAAYGVDMLFGTEYTDNAQTNVANYLHRKYGDMRDYSGYTGLTALEDEIEIGVVEMRQADEKVLTSVRNNVQASDNVAYAKGQVAVAEALNAGKSESEADADMQAAIDNYFTSIQKNILNHYTTQFDQARHHATQWLSHPDVDETAPPSSFGQHRYDDVANAYDFDAYEEVVQALSTEHTSGNEYREVEIVSIDLLDGSTQNVECLTHEASDWRGWVGPCNQVPDKLTLDSANSTPWTVEAGGPMAIDFVNGTQTMDETADSFYTYVDVDRYRNAWADLVTTRDNVKADLSGYVTDVYGTYEPGDVDISDIVDPTTMATELSQDNNLRGFRKAAAAQMGMPTATEHNVVVDIHFDGGDERLWVDLFTDHVPTDADGNEVGFEVGIKYDPTSWTEPLFVVFEKEDGTADKTQLETPFTIVEAYDDSGNEVTSFSTTSTNTHTSDVQQFEEELNQLREAQLELLETYSELDSGGGATDDSGGLFDALGFTIGGLDVPGVVTAIGGGAGVLYGGAKAGLIGAKNTPTGKAASKAKNRK